MSKLGKIYYLMAGISLVCFALFRFLLGTWVPFLWVCLGLLTLFLGLAWWKDRSFYRDFFSMKTTKQGMSMGGMIATTLVLLIAVNFIAVRKYKTFDFSAAKINTLSDQSVKLLGQLQDELKVLYFYQKGTEGVEENRHAFIEIMKKYQDQSSAVKLEFVDVNERPDLTEKYGVTKNNGIVFLEYKGRKSQIQKIDEQEITSALVKVTREKDKSIYITLGHGERDLEDGKEASGAQFLKQLLEGNRYTVKPLNLINSPKVPEDADVVMIVGPTQSFMDAEVTALENYLKAGGSLVIAVEPKIKHNLGRILADVGAVLKDNYLVNFMDTPIGRAVNPQGTAGSIFSPTQQITKPFGKSQVTVFRLPQEVGQAEKLPAGISAEALVRTSDKTMAFSDTKFQGEGKIGSYALAQIFTGHLAGVDEKSPAMSVVLFGNSDFMSNQLLYQNLNRDLVLNTVASLVKEENLISISPKEVGITKMQITPTQFTMFVFAFILPLPLAFLALSIALWFRRRYA
jgi:ABC-type uncharacterized transport system involved in gliding motility auxiliary subunit